MELPYSRKVSLQSLCSAGGAVTSVKARPRLDTWS